MTSIEHSVIVAPAVALLASGTICQTNRTAARTGDSSWQFAINRRMNVHAMSKSMLLFIAGLQGNYLSLNAPI
jgi:hypothetical protein